MAIIYGQPGAEKDLLKECPENIEKFEDIKPTLINHQNDLHSKRNIFYQELPNIIVNEKEKLEEREKLIVEEEEKKTDDELDKITEAS